MNGGKLGSRSRVTVNAHPASLNRPGVAATAEQAEIRTGRFERLSERIGELLPSATKAADMTVDRLPAILAGAFEVAVSKAFPTSRKSTFQPLSIVRYADGQQMLSITGVIVRRDEEKAIWDKMQMAKWPFSSKDWETIHKLVVPDLTLQERLFLEKGILTKKSEDLIKELGFDSAADIRMADFLKSYRNYYRFYPTLLAAQM